jgi:hypothetical protein
MKAFLRTVGVFACISFMVSAAVAQPEGPVPGEYTSFDGEILEGRGTESWPSGVDLVTGTVLNLASWDGSSLALQWYLHCPEASEVTLLLDNVNSFGNGFKMYQIVYVGGVLWLEGDGEAWSPDEPLDAFTVDLDDVVAVVTITYVSHNPVGWVTNFQAMGQFCDMVQEPPDHSCIDLFLSNMARIDDTGDPADDPADFPDFLDALDPGGEVCFSGEDCEVVPDSDGSFWTVTDITMNILGDCVVPVTHKSWGAVKNLYR